MTRRPRRRIGQEDEDLWRKVTREATPLDPARRGGSGAPPPETGPAPAAKAGAEPAPAPAAPTPAPQEKLPPRRVRPQGPAAPAAARIDLAERDLSPVGRPAPGLDKRTAERLRRGMRQPGIRLDLHGMTAERAHLALDRCIARAMAAGERLILVITGKGGRGRAPDDVPYMRGDRGVLRQLAPDWLRTGPHARHIVGIYQAHERHGGSGAFYVYLKKRR